MSNTDKKYIMQLFCKISKTKNQKQPVKCYSVDDVLTNEIEKNWKQLQQHRKEIKNGKFY